MQPRGGNRLVLAPGSETGLRNFRFCRFESCRAHHFMDVDIRAIDCLEGMATLAPRSVDAVVTSPPYNRGVRYSRYQDRRTDYLEWCGQWLAGVARVLADRGSFFLNLGTFKDPTLPFQMVLEASRHFVLQNTIHWIKSISIGDTSYGHFKPVTSRRYLNHLHEYVFHFTRSGSVTVDRLAVGVPYADKSNVKRWAHTGGSDRRCRGNVWFIPYETIQNRNKERPHPATFPVALALKCLHLHGRPGAVVMDPFLGIGSTALAAQQCNCLRFVGFDIDAGYAQVAMDRLCAALV